MIDDLDKDMDNAVGTLDMVTTRTKELIKKSGEEPLLPSGLGHI